ncbi:TolC family protein, partial [Bacteroidota bacterium]
MRYIILIFLFVFSTYVFSQTDLSSFLYSVKENNKELITERHNLDAEKYNLKTGLMPDNPFIEYGHFPGNKSEIGVKKTLSVTQSFDFPTLYISNKTLSNKLINLAELEYRIIEQEILFDAKLKYYEYSKLLKIQNEYSERYINAERIYNSYEKKFKNGDIS